MDVDANQANGSANHGKTVASNDPSLMRQVVVITPYNPNPQTPCGKQIVERIRRLSPGLVRSTPVVCLAADAHGAKVVELTSRGPPRTDVLVDEGAVPAVASPKGTTDVAQFGGQQVCCRLGVPISVHGGDGAQAADASSGLLATWRFHGLVRGVAATPPLPPRSVFSVSAATPTSPLHLA